MCVCAVNEHNDKNREREINERNGKKNRKKIQTKMFRNSENLAHEYK